jgi:hypothetical protein
MKQSGEDGREASMGNDLGIILMFWAMVLAPCVVAINAGEWGTEEDGGYERGHRTTKRA